MKQISFAVVIALLLICQVKSYNDPWNRIFKIDSNLTSQDYTFKGEKNSNSQTSNLYQGPFYIEVYNDHIIFVIPYDNAPPLVINARLQSLNSFSLNSEHYLINENDINGSISYEVVAGVRWNVTLNINKMGLALQRSVIVNEYANWIILLLFGGLGFSIFPLCDRSKGQLMYNIRKRTNPLLSWTILFKFSYFWACVLTTCLTYSLNLPWYYLVFTWTIYLFCLGPSLPQGIYFLGALQNRVKEYEWYQKLQTQTGTTLMIALFISAPLLAVILSFLNKGVTFFFLFSIPTIYQFVNSWKRKQYSLTYVLFYEGMLTLVIFAIGLFLPCLNFTPLTWKDTVIFWNYYLGVLIIGFLLSSKIINMEISQEHHLQQESNFQEPREQVQSESERRQEIPNVGTNNHL